MKEYSVLIFQRCFVHILNFTLHCCCALELKEMLVNLLDNVLAENCQCLFYYFFSAQPSLTETHMQHDNLECPDHGIHEKTKLSVA